MNKWNSREIIEIVGILALVGSLIFVGLELRQNSAIARMEAHSEFVASMSERLMATSTNPQLATLIYDISSEEKSLGDISGGERVQILSYYQANVFVWYSLFQSIQEGILEEKYLKNIGGGRLQNTDTFRAVWPGFRDDYSDEFVEFFESLPWNTGN